MKIKELEDRNHLPSAQHHLPSNNVAASSLMVAPSAKSGRSLMQIVQRITQFHIRPMGFQPSVSNSQNVMQSSQSAAALRGYNQSPQPMNFQAGYPQGGQASMMMASHYPMTSQPTSAMMPPPPPPTSGDYPMLPQQQQQPPPSHLQQFNHFNAQPVRQVSAQPKSNEKVKIKRFPVSQMIYLIFVTLLD